MPLFLAIITKNAVIDCSQPSIFLYFCIFVEPMDRIMRELDASAKGRLDWVGVGMEINRSLFALACFVRKHHPPPPLHPCVLCVSSARISFRVR